MVSAPNVPLNDGHQIPQLGLGVWKVSNNQMTSVIQEALSAGYRSIDTASAYENEEGVGEAVQNAPLPRDQLFITTKLWNDSQGYDNAFRALDESLEKLKMDYLDLYLIHWPVPQADAYVDTWRALIKMKEEERIRSIGVCNFQVPHLQRLFEETGVAPAVNQIELHPYLQQRELRDFHSRHRIVTESWSPLAQGEMVHEPVIQQIARKHRKTPAQIVLRWNVQNQLVAIPKSVTPARIRENIAVFDFQLDPEDLQRIWALEQQRRVGPDPDTFNLDAVSAPARGH